MAVVTPLNNPGGPEGDTVTVVTQLLNTEYKTIQSHTMSRLAWYPLRGYKGYCSELIEVKVRSHTPYM